MQWMTMTFKSSQEITVHYESSDRGMKFLDGSIDCVFMSDALLFYFVPEGPNQKGNIDVLLQDVHRILKSNGSFVCVDPHYLFWLMAWLGEERFPFAIVNGISTRPSA